MIVPLREDGPTAKEDEDGEREVNLEGEAA